MAQQSSGGPNKKKSTNKKSPEEPPGSISAAKQNHLPKESNKDRVPELMTSSIPEEDITSSSTAKLNNDAYVDRLAGSLSRKLEKSKAKLRNRPNDTNLYKASPDSKNPSVILSCASSGDESLVEEKPKKVRDSLTADQSGSRGRLIRGLLKVSKTQKKELMFNSKQKKESTEHVGDKNLPGGSQGGLTSTSNALDDNDSLGSPTHSVSSNSPPASVFSHHRGSFSTLIQAVGTVELLQKVQRSAHDLRQERDVKELKKQLDVHVSGNYQIKFGPVLPIWQAVFVFLVNLVIPGLGTIISGFLLITCHTFRTAEVKTKYSLAGHFAIVLVIGISQFMTVTFILIGWIWAMVWGCWLIQLSMEHKKLVERERIIETHEQAGRLSIQVTGPPSNEDEQPK